MTSTGGCLCGQARYRLNAAPLTTLVCHCRNCQRQSGSAFSIVTVVATRAFERTGAWKAYDDTADSGAVLRREFCPECGSALASTLVASPDMTVIKAGTLDDVSGLKPQMHIWTQSAQPWVCLEPDLPQFPGQPPGA